MESNKTYHYLFKYSFVGISVVLILGAVVSWVSPESITVNGEPGKRDLLMTTIFALLAILALLLFLLVRKKFAIVELGNQTIKIKTNGQDKPISWLEVEEIKLIQFVYPPLYKIKVKNDESTIWFNTEPEFISISGFVRDTSEMGRLINKKKRELGI
jgi:hypothetical protein